MSKWNIRAFSLIPRVALIVTVVFLLALSVDTKLVSTQNGGVALEVQVNTNTTDITSNTTGISTNASAISVNTNDIAVLDGRVSILEAANPNPAPPCFDNVNRYVDCGNGTVTDTVTGLIWLQDANCFGTVNWGTAGSVAAALSDGQCGLTDGSKPGDWRLATKAEWDETIARAVALGCTQSGANNPPSLTN